MMWMYETLPLSVLAEEVIEKAWREPARRRGNAAYPGQDPLAEDRREEATAALEEALSWARTMPYPYAEVKLLSEHATLNGSRELPGDPPAPRRGALDRV